MKKSNKFSPEVRERAVRMVFEHRGEYSSLWATIESIAPKIGCVPQTLHDWVRKHEIDTGMRDGVTSAERDRVKALEREVRELRKANEILRRRALFSPRRSSTADSSPTYPPTSIGTPTGSSRSARCCRLPRQAIDAMPDNSGTLHCVVLAPSMMTC